MSKITPELQKQIEQEAKSDSSSYGYFPGSEEDEDLQSVYRYAGEKYALKWQEEKELRERYEKALKEIMAKAKEGIFPHLPVETMGAQMCIEIDKYITDLLTPKQTTDDTDR